MTKHNWTLLPAPAAKQSQELQRAVGIGPVLAGLLIQRGIRTADEARRFLHPDFQDLHDPNDFYQMDLALERIEEAVFTGEKILVYGDYDVDGLTATAIMVETIATLGGEAVPYIPSRFTDGYGPNLKTYERLLAEVHPDLIITVDNGVTGESAFAYAKEQGVDVIVTDHHRLPDELPASALAVIHPAHPEGNYPFQGLSGAGVAFKVAQAVLADGQPAESLADLPVDLFDLVALGALADVMDVTDENRALITWGLEQIEQNPRPGLQALLKLAKHAPGQPVLSETIGFKIAPRLNALGRLGDGQLGLDLLLTKEAAQAQELAKQVEQINEQRRTLVDQVLAEAKPMAAAAHAAGHRVLVLAGQDWHEGILGIVAARIAETFATPTIVLTEKNGLYKGSGRSVADFDLHAFLLPFADQLTAFGGHAGALGLSVAAAALADWQDAVQAASRTLTFHQPALAVNLILPAKSLSTDLYQEIRTLEPFGLGNEQPVLAVQHVPIQAVTSMGADKQHLKLSFAGQRGPVEALAFNQPDLVAASQGLQTASLAGQLGSNHFAGRDRLQLMLADVVLERFQQGQAEQQGPSLATALKKTTPADFALLYKYLYQHQQAALIANLQPALRDLHFLEKQFKLMIAVFLELEFVKMQGDQIVCLPQQGKTALSQSPTYQRYFAANTEEK
ncbi:single-stranded-DNA-specific exonuclease RecJ [Leuconostocaceae bacterium ESL0958]|nr:single-stranded-DNA-specific exonuclease RecJ [Leuconostocaceae bacterium ESL0958]